MPRFARHAGTLSPFIYLYICTSVQLYLNVCHWVCSCYILKKIYYKFKKIGSKLLKLHIKQNFRNIVGLPVCLFVYFQFICAIISECVLFFVFFFLYVCMWKCVYVYMCVYVNVCMCVCMCVCVYVCICICVYGCMCICVYVWMYVCVYV